MYLEILILAQLEYRPMHGYEIKKESERILGNIYVMNNNSLYPILKRLEKSGAILKHFKQQQGKPNKNIYSITPLGIEMLNKMVVDYPEGLSIINMEFYARLTCFDQIGPEDRKAIIVKRREAVCRMKSHFEALTEDIQEIQAVRRSYPVDVVGLLMKHVQAELDWIDGFAKKMSPTDI